ncbi:MAG: aminotransferase class V-fold PLP-dependent enzyme [Chloroflexi bacterium]|nr:aminotransferase class V-fold PLP-dependent enzyme [Chloroflexota bacterium]
MKKVYLDNMATTRVLPEVLQAMLPYFGELYGNPSSLHSWGDEAREAMDEARAKVAALINAAPEEIIFTSTGTESNNLAIKGIAQAYQEKGKHIVISAVEHFSVMHSVKTLEKRGFSSTLVPVDKYAMVDPSDVARAIRKDTILVSVMHSNGEVGTIEPVKEIAAIAKKAGAVFHTDAVASAGNVPVDVKELGVDALSLAANQFYGPKGVAALYVRRGVRLVPLFDGGIQEGGRRAGTDNVPGIVGMGKAAELAKKDMAARANLLQPLRDRLIEGVLKIDHSILTGHPSARLPHHASFCIEFIEGEAMLMLLNLQGVAASSGSACTSRALKASHVLLAKGIPHALAQGSLLFGFGVDRTAGDVDYVLEVLPPVVDRLREMSPLYDKYIKARHGVA